MNEEPRERPKLTDQSLLRQVSEKVSEYVEMRAHFAPIEAKFAALPDDHGPPLFSVGETVKFPAEQDNNELCEWQVVRTEKRHYLLERPAGNNLYHHVFCSEEELIQRNPK